MIPYGKHHIDGKDIKEVIKVLKSNNLTQGPLIKKFENSISKYVGSKYAVAGSSCTAGLHLASIISTNLSKTKALSPFFNFKSISDGKFDLYSYKLSYFFNN